MALGIRPPEMGWVGRGLALTGSMALAWLGTAFVQAEDVTLKNGLVLHGTVSAIGELPTRTLKMPSSSGSEGPAVGVQVKLIAVVDDGLRRTVFSKRLDPNGPVATPEVVERIVIPQRVADAGNAVQVIGSILGVTPFDKYGRRVFSMAGGPKGRVDVIQGITEVNPVYCKVEGLVASTSYTWDMRVATSSIPGNTLRQVLHSRIDPKDAEARLKVIRLLIKSQRIPEATAEIEKAIEDFPELAAMKTQRQALKQFNAERAIEEIKFRREAGQHRLAMTMIDTFPADDVAKVKLVEIRDIGEEYGKLATQGEAIRAKLKAVLAECQDESLRARLTPYVREIRRELNFNNVNRMEVFARLQDDPTLEPPEKLALAISGWLLGTADESFKKASVAISLGETRDLIRRYMQTILPGEHAEIVKEIESQEAGTPQYVAQLIKHMRPIADVFEPPSENNKKPKNNIFEKLEDKKAEAEKDAKDEPAIGPAKKDKAKGKRKPVDAMRRDPKAGKQPAAIAANEEVAAEKSETPVSVTPEGESPEGVEKESPKVEELDDDRAKPVENPEGLDPNIPGLFRFEATPIAGQPSIPFVVQLPPEYDPLRKYPAVVTLAKPGTPLEQQVTWWAGEYDDAIQSRRGQATRHGYIVIAPQWSDKHQFEYKFSAREHAAALGSLREAMKRFSINSDRVFISGHGTGGDAAWDIALAHPDLWAGLICIGGKSDKYIDRYHGNGRYVPMYFVEGSLEGDKRLVNNAQFNRYMMAGGKTYDFMMVEYLGRGPESFFDESLRIFEWMKLHGRNFFPEQFGKQGESGLDIISMRKWDNFFWWLEISEFPTKAIALSEPWPPSKDNKPLLLSSGYSKQTNSVLVKPGLTKGRVWLAPEMVDFDKKGSVDFSGTTRKIPLPKAEVKVILEDVRTRGDRDHPFWAHVDYSFVK